MEVVLLVVRLLLAAMFLVAGLAKLADQAGSRQSLLDFGVPATLAGAGGTLLPLAELFVAMLLIPAVTVWWGGLGALVLLLVFIAGIGYNLARGRTPDCHCFGQLHSAPAGRPTLARNAVLALVAAVIVAQGPRHPQLSTVAWPGALTGMQLALLLGGIVLLALLLGEGWLLLNLLRQNGRLLLRIEALETHGGAAPAGSSAPQPMTGLPVGTPAPRFELASLADAPLTLDGLRAPGKPVMLVFSDPGCGPCTALLPDLARWQEQHAATLTIALVSRGTPEANRAKLTEHGLTNVVLQHDREIAEAYQAQGTPTAVIVRADGTIGSPLAPGAEAIATLVARTAAPSTPVPHANALGSVPVQPVVAPIGAPAPALTLPDLQGEPVSLADFRGRSTLLLFWNPGCGFCQRMLNDLKAWEAKPPKGAPQLLVVSTGLVEDNRVMDLRAPVVLDQGFSAGRQFGATGTPMALLIDSDGRIASDVAAGGPAVMRLANDPHQLKLLPV